MDGIIKYYLKWSKTNTEKGEPTLSFKCESYKTWLECRLVTSRGWERGKAVCGESDTGFDQWMLLSCIEIVYLIKLIYIFNICLLKKK